MNYSESADILKSLQSANKILVNCHIHPDHDSICSALALKQVIRGMNKYVDVVSPDAISYSYPKLVSTITVASFNEIDFSSYDLMIVLDSQSWNMLNLNSKPEIKTIVVDHHPRNSIDADIKILDIQASSVCEMLYLLFVDWDENIETDLAELLLAGIVSDSGAFQQENTTKRTLQVASELMGRGVEIERITYEILRQFSFDTVKFWGEMISRIEIDREHGFAWAAIPFEIYSRFDLEGSPTSSFTNQILRRIVGTNFCIAMNEKEKGVLNVSLRSRVPGYVVSGIAEKLGGGGHKEAAGCQVKGDFDNAVNQVLETARQWVKTSL